MDQSSCDLNQAQLKSRTSPQCCSIYFNIRSSCTVISTKVDILKKAGIFFIGCCLWLAEASWPATEVFDNFQSFGKS